MPVARVSKPKAKDCWEAAVLVVDCGRTMMGEKRGEAEESEEGQTTDCGLATQIADWILSRKIFSQSFTKFIIVLVGLSEQPLMLSDDDFTTASFEHLKFILDNAKCNRNKDADVLEGVSEALSLFKEKTWSHGEDDDLPHPEVLSRHLIVLSNGKAETRTASEDIQQMVNQITEEQINLVVVGVDDQVEHDDLSAASALCELADKTETVVYTFDDSMSMLSHYLGRSVQPRASKKAFEIAPDIRLPLNLYISTQPGKNPIKAALADEMGYEVKRNRVYVPKDETAGVKMDIDGEPQTARGGTQRAAAADEFEEPVISKKYFFGKDLIEVSDEAIPNNGHNFNEGERGGFIKLICFVDSKQVLPQYLVGNTSYIGLPETPVTMKSGRGPKIPESKLTIALIASMIEENTVALCRYAYSVSSNVQPMFLFPNKDEQGNYYFRCVTAPFYENMKSASFTNINKESGKPSTLQKKLMGELIDTFDLSKDESLNVNSEKVLNPKFQKMCSAMKMKALHPDMDITSEEARESLKMDYFTQKKMTQNEKLLEEAREIFAALKKELNLAEVPKKMKNGTSRLPGATQVEAELMANEDVIVEEQPLQEDNINLVVKVESPDDEVDPKLLSELGKQLMKEMVIKGGEAVDSFIEKIDNKIGFTNRIQDYSKFFYYKTISCEINTLRRQVTAMGEEEFVQKYHEYLQQMKRAVMYRDYLEWMLDTDDEEGYRISPITKVDYKPSPFRHSESFTFWIDVMAVKQKIKEETE